MSDTKNITANEQRMLSRLETIERHSRMKINVIELVIDKSHLSKTKKHKLIKMFCQAKWLYNHFIFELGENKTSKDINKQPATVMVKCGDEWEERELNALGSLMKSGIFKRIMSQLKGLSTAKEKGEKVGCLKYKTRMDSIPLRKRGEGYSFKDKSKKPFNYIRFTNNDSWHRVSGGAQIKDLIDKYGEDACEFADGKLIEDKCGRLLVHITIYTPYDAHENTGQVVALDFGASGDAHVTTSDGEIVSWKFDETERLKDAQRRNQIFRDWSEKKKGYAKSSKHQRDVICREYSKINNRKDDAANKFVHDLFEFYDYVVLQDEQLASWLADEKYSGSVHHSVMGRVLARLRNHPRAIIIDKWTPTTKVCSCCGHVLDSGLSCDVREWVCSKCGVRLHRDVNACEVMLLEASSVLNKLVSVSDTRNTSTRITRDVALRNLVNRVGDQSVI